MSFPSCFGPIKFTVIYQQLDRVPLFICCLATAVTSTFNSYIMENENKISSEMLSYCRLTEYVELFAAAGRREPIVGVHSPFYSRMPKFFINSSLSNSLLCCNANEIAKFTLGSSLQHCDTIKVQTLPPKGFNLTQPRQAALLCYLLMAHN